MTRLQYVIIWIESLTQRENATADVQYMNAKNTHTTWHSLVLYAPKSVCLVTNDVSTLTNGALVAFINERSSLACAVAQLETHVNVLSKIMLSGVA